MDESSKITHILGYLSDQLFRAWSAFLVAKYINQVLEDGDIKSLHYFFVATYASCTESTILALSKLTIPQNDSMHIEYLLNCCEQNPQAFADVDKDEILHSVRAHRQQIKEVRPLIKHIKLWRDQAVAHLDRKYVNDPASISSILPINMNEVEKAFILLEQIINTYKAYLNTSGFQLRDSEAKMAEDWEYLIRLIQRDNQMV